MVLLRNISEHDGLIEFDVIPEGKTGNLVHMILDKATLAVTNGLKLDMYTSMARNRIKNLLQAGDLPKEASSAWY